MSLSFKEGGEREKLRGGLIKNKKGGEEGGLKKRKRDDEEGEAEGAGSGGGNESGEERRREPKKRKQGPKGPNPLAMKKKKVGGEGGRRQEEAISVTVGDLNGGNVGGEGHGARRKRSRKHKSDAAPGGTVEAREVSTRNNEEVDGG